MKASTSQPAEREPQKCLHKMYSTNFMHSMCDLSSEIFMLFLIIQNPELDKLFIFSEFTEMFIFNINMFLKSTLCFGKIWLVNKVMTNFSCLVL